MGARSRRALIASGAAALAVLAIGATLSVAAWKFTLDESHARAQQAVSAAVHEARSSLAARLRGYYDVLYGLQGLFRASGQVSREALKRYVESVAVTRLADARSFSYAVPARGASGEYSVVYYLEPFAGTDRDIGLDLASDPHHRASIARARDTGMPVATAPFSLMSAPTKDHPAFSLRLALFREGLPLDTVEQRRHAFFGALSATFLVRESLGDIVRAAEAQGLHVRAFELGDAARGTEPLLLLASEGAPPTSFRQSASVDVAGREWRLDFAAAEERFVPLMERRFSGSVLAAGLVASLLLAGLVYSLGSARARALRLAEQITVDLRRSESSLQEAQHLTQAMIEALPNPFFFKDTDGRYLAVNRAWERFFGIPRGQFVGKTVHELYRHAPEIGERLHAMDQDLWRNPGEQVYEATIRTADGATHETLYYKATVARPDGRVAGLLGTIIDLTERRRIEKRHAMEHAVTRLLAQAGSLAEAVPEVIRVVCGAMGWQCGIRWAWDAEAQLFRFCECWGADEPAIVAFLEATATHTVPLARHDDGPPGLVRRAFAARRPAWVNVAAGDAALVRAPLARQAGLQSGFSFPVLIGEEPLGVLEFFHNDPGDPDEALLQIAQSIGSQLGQFAVRKQAEETLRFVASHDALTGLPNRAMFNQRLEHALHQARRRASTLAVLFVDLDRFKFVNDTLGHEAGDALLREAATRLKGVLRASDTAARLGGDEFVVLVEEFTEPAALAAVAQKLLEALAAPFMLQGRECQLSASIGVSSFPADAQTMEALLKNADIAMYRAKEQGRNAFQFYSRQMSVLSEERLALESGLRRALEHGELLLHYQPIASLRTGKVVGVEALLRWQHPELGLLPPGRFIGLAEETGLIASIGDWVLNTACARQSAWRREGKPLRMSVNLSARQFLYEDLAMAVERALAQHGCDPEWLELEITESTVMHNPERAARVLHEVRQRGVAVAIDDFGTGHSSLASLRQFPASKLKIDRSFVQDIATSNGDGAIVEAVLAMARSLGMAVVAEGVETRAQYDFLQSRNCDEAQGYYISKPLPEAALLHFVDAAAPTPHT